MPRPAKTLTSPARCSQCGLAFEANSWHELELVERIADERVRDFVTSWRDDVMIEVRRCTCGRVIARKVR
jgi:DNA-directed RNA polymerase subunit N (RpoN/RPB10)